MEEESHNNLKPKRERSPSFPYLDLKTCINLTSKLLDSARGSEIRIFDAAGVFGMAATSGSLMRYISALGQYGLISVKGSGTDRKIRVTENGKRIIEDDRLGVKEALCSEAALKPKILNYLYNGHKEIMPWAFRRPDNPIAESTLKFEYGFTSIAAKRLLSIYDNNLIFIKTDENQAKPKDSNPPLTLESKTINELKNDEAFENDEVEEPNLVTPTKLTPSNLIFKQTREELDSGNINQIDFKSLGGGRILISANLDKNGLDELKNKIEAFKLILD